MCQTIISRRTLSVLISTCGIGCCAWLLSSLAVCDDNVEGATRGAGPQAKSHAAAVTDAPSPALAPEDVARAQMEALSGAGAVEKRIERCYRFASPANRVHTGPIEHFAQMVQAPQYAPLLTAKRYLVGHATQQKNEAFLLVTAVDSAGELTLFRFLLSKQTKDPYADCWMTDAVIRVGNTKNPGDSEKPINDGEPI